MTSERIQRRIERFLDETDEAAAQLDWERVREHAHGVLGLDSENQEALTYLAAAERNLALKSASKAQDAISQGEPSTSETPANTPSPEPPRISPTSFVNGRYVVKRFLGEGGKKIVYETNDNILDRDVAYAEIKT
ncbi:MAG: hypothetical protein EXR50_05645, partial [Dehalococcoidia bacterium]|nr:hypothetical protein [Dehalococcoidia bacterium]